LRAWPNGIWLPCGPPQGWMTLQAADPRARWRDRGRAVFWMTVRNRRSLASLGITLMTRSITATLLAACAISPLAAQSKPLITPKDYGRWESIVGVRLSPRGDWAAVSVNRVSEENELRLRGGPRDTTIVVTYGTAPTFSADGKWIAYAIGVSPKEREKLTKE